MLRALRRVLALALARSLSGSERPDDKCAAILFWRVRKLAAAVTGQIGVHTHKGDCSRCGRFLRDSFVWMADWLASWLAMYVPRVASDRMLLQYALVV